MTLLCFSNARPRGKFAAFDRTGRPVGRRRPIRLNTVKRLRYSWKRSIAVACSQGWLKSVPLEHKQDSFWLISL